MSNMPSIRSVTVFDRHRLAPREATCSMLLLAVPLALLGGGEAAAQASRTRPRPANPAEVKRLDTKFDEVQSAFVRETTSLLTSYESLGQYDRVKTILEAFAKLDPKNDQLKAKLAELDERICLLYTSPSPRD